MAEELRRECWKEYVAVQSLLRAEVRGTSRKKQYSCGQPKARNLQKKDVENLNRYAHTNHAQHLGSLRPHFKSREQNWPDIDQDTAETCCEPEIEGHGRRHERQNVTHRQENTTEIWLRDIFENDLGEVSGRVKEGEEAGTPQENVQSYAAINYDNHQVNDELQAQRTISQAKKEKDEEEEDDGEFRLHGDIGHIAPA